MVAHLWAHQSQPSARSNNGNLFFRDSTIYSYGGHFPIARHVNGVVLFTTAHYSITTSAHSSRVRQACSHLEVFHVPHVTDNRHRDNFESYKARLADAMKAAVRARTNTEWRLREAEQIVAEANRYNKVFKLRRKPLEMPANLDAIREKVKQESAKKAAIAKTREKRLRTEMAEAVVEWRNGQSRNVGRYPDTLLRIVGDEIQTSHGARFSVEHGRKAFGIIKRCHDNGKTYRHNGHTIHLGMFTIDEIKKNGDVRAGCHYVKWEEIAATANQLNLI